MDTPCIEHPGKRNAKGYVRVYLGMVDGKALQMYAHRLAWAALHGPIPKGLVVMHECDNPPCWNVEHLRLGTKGDNNRQMFAKGRNKNGSVRRTHCRRGHLFDEANVVFLRNGSRICATCKRDRERRRYRRGREVLDGSRGRSAGVGSDGL